MSVKWHGCRSVPRKVKGGGPQGTTIRLLEYLSQSNNSADCVKESERFRFIDDLSVLEFVNLLTVGITSFNIKQQVANDIPNHNQYIPPQNLESQEWLNTISDWTVKQKIMLNEKKSKTMIFNYSHNNQFTTRLYLNDKPLEVVSSTLLLGTVIQDNLRWDMNISRIVKKANARMELLRKVASFTTNIEDLKNIYILFIRSLLEQSATVWHSSLSEENKSDLERVQKTAFKIILGKRYKTYKQAQNILELETLNDRRETLCLNFALKSSKNPKTKHMFPLNDKTHGMTMRKSSKFKVQHANNERLRKSGIVYMQNLLNKYEES